MSTDSDGFETIEVPKGQYVSWAAKPGQVVIGEVTAYGDADGTDANGNECPQISMDLSADAVTLRDGERQTIESGEAVTINAGQASLKKALKKAQPKPGDKVKISFVDTAKTAKGTAKVFEVAIKRAAPVGGGEEDPPF